MERRGIVAILVASVLSATSGAGIFYAHEMDPQFSPIAGVLVRTLASFSCFLPLLLAGHPAPRLQPWKTDKALWLWGLFGAMTLLTYFMAITRIGAGRATVFNAGSGILIAVLAPKVAKQKVPVAHLLAAPGCLLGMTLLTASSGLGAEGTGTGLAILSGLCSALAYLMIARTGPRHKTETVLLHWTFINLFAVGAMISFTSCTWPRTPWIWSILGVSGIFMAWAQYWTALAYQSAAASTVACLSFLSPLLSLLVDLTLFKVPLSNGAIAGALTVLACGLIIPLSTSRASVKHLVQKNAR